MDLSIIIINFRTPRITAACLKSLRQSTDKLTKEVIVVDNASVDGSVEYLRQKFPWVKVYELPKNFGFAGGNNYGFRKSTGRYVWLLNSDTLVHQDTIQKLFAAVEAKHSVIASCRLLTKTGRIQPQGGFLPNLWRVKAWMLFIDDLPGISAFFPAYHVNRLSYFKKNQQPEWLAGTALLISREAYQKLNGLDDKIFMYGEDVEFCWRAKRHGIRVDYFSQPSLTHLGQASGSSRGAILGEFKGLKYIYRKHCSGWRQLALKILLKLGSILRVIILRNRIYAEAFKLA